MPTILQDSKYTASPKASIVHRIMISSTWMDKGNKIQAVANQAIQTFSQDNLEQRSNSQQQEELSHPYPIMLYTQQPIQ